MKWVVISLGGSIIVPFSVDTKFLTEFRQLVIRKAKNDYGFAIICGGGKTCRDYQAATRQICKISDNDSDLVGIAATKLNAELVRAVFGKYAYENVVYNPKEKVVTKKRIIIGAGYLPGHSTDQDAVLRAKTQGSNTVVNMSDVSFIYDKNPKEHPDAKPLERLTWHEYKKIVGTKWVPGLKTPFDPVAAREAEKNKMTVVIIKGTDLENLTNYLDQKGFKGTVIG
jgi:uridylate kinase